jgi:hypothetical protein
VFLPSFRFLHHLHSFSSLLTLVVMLVYQISAIALIGGGMVMADYGTQAPIVESVWLPSQVYPTIYASIIASVCSMSRKIL